MKVVKSSFKMTTTAYHNQRALGVAPVLMEGDFRFGYPMWTLERGDVVSIRVGCRRKLFRVDAVETDTLGYDDGDTYHYTRIHLRPKAKK